MRIISNDSNTFSRYGNRSPRQLVISFEPRLLIPEASLNSLIAYLARSPEIAEAVYTRLLRVQRDVVTLVEAWESMGDFLTRDPCAIEVFYSSALEGIRSLEDVDSHPRVRELDNLLLGAFRRGLVSDVVYTTGHIMSMLFNRCLRHERLSRSGFDLMLLSECG